jgi:Bacterial regulatory proteins, tetR family
VAQKALGDGRPLGEGARQDVGEDLVAGPEPGDPLAHRLDLAGHVAVEHPVGRRRSRGLEVVAQPRAPLSWERVLRAAVALADERGVEAISMRRIAQQLGVVPMALYKHVANKDELLDGLDGLERLRDRS